MDALRDESRSCRSSGEGGDCIFCCPFICASEKRASHGGSSGVGDGAIGEDWIKKWGGVSTIVDASFSSLR